MTDKLHPAKRLLAGALAVIGVVAGAYATIVAFAAPPMSLPFLALGIAGIISAVVLLRVAGSGRRPSKRAALASVLGATAPLVVLKLTVFASSSMPPARDRAYMTEMRTQLRRVARAEAAYYEGRGKYTDDLSALDTTLFRPAPNVFLTVARADTMGWRAVATADRTAYICSLSVARAAGEVHDQELEIRCEK